MRVLLCTLLVIFIISGCRKPPEKVTYHCSTPGIVLQQQGFDATDIRIIPRYEQAPEGQRPECYHDISFNLDDQLISGLDASTGRVYAQLMK